MLHNHWFRLSFPFECHTSCFCWYTHTHSFHQFYIKLPKATILYLQLHVSQPFSLSAWPLVCYRSVHTPLFTRVQLQSTQLLPQSFWLHWVYHFSVCRHFYIYYGFCCLVCCLSLLLSLCFCYAVAEWVLFSWLIVSLFPHLLLPIMMLTAHLTLSIPWILMKNYSRAYSVSW